MSSLARWDELSPLLKPVLEKMMDGLHTLDTLKEYILSGQAQWWPMKNSVIVTELISYPRGKVMRFWLAAGELEELKQGENILSDHARSIGCTHMEINGRPGWVKKLDGYKEITRTFAKEL